MNRAASALLSVRELSVSYRVRQEHHRVRLRAIHGLSFELAAGETLGVVGESGSGKSTIARALLRLVEAESGEAWFQGRDLLKLSNAELHPLRRHLQLIFQDPIGSLDPHMSIGETLSEPLRVF